MTASFARIDAVVPLPSPARVHPSSVAPLRIGLIQHAWQSDGDELTHPLDEGIGIAAAAGARIVFLPELTLSRYPASRRPTERPDATSEDLETGQTRAFAAAAAARHDVFVHASLFERTGDADGRGLNTAIVVSPAGDIVAKTHKLHIPVTAGYYEDAYFRPGPADGTDAAGAAQAASAPRAPHPGPYPVYDLDGLPGAHFGLPTCWDEWFPEVARAYSLGGANVVVYPTAIGSEPDHPAFDTQPLWQQVIVGNGIANGLFMVVPNRIGTERSADGTNGITFYGSSFVSDPYGRILAQAPRDAEAVLVVDLDLAQRDDWLDLFPFLQTRRPDTYGALLYPVNSARPAPETA
jgi:N-carbamoylputrescine amidase